MKRRKKPSGAAASPPAGEKGKRKAETVREGEHAGIPPEARHVLRRLAAAGYEAWCVGGCVRDTLLGRIPRDWDVTTSAKPEEVKAVFPGRTIPTGLKHGTVTVLSGRKMPIEVTTFRLDGPYADHRRPSSVSFTGSLEEDLRRRDFTMNAIAMGRDGAIRDPFGGEADLRAGIVRCVGEADARFSEDALRMMRALRFASILDFSIEASTAESIHRNRGLLSEIAAERIQAELWKLLAGARAAEILREFPDVIGVFWPEILDMVGFAQHNPHHCYDVWEHSLRALDAVQAAPAAEARDIPLLRCTMLLHDIGKPKTFSRGENGVGHFYAHAAAGREMVDAMLRRLRFPNAIRERIARLVEWHDRDVSQTEKSMRRTLARLGEADTRALIALKRADNLAQPEEFRFRQKELDRAEALIGDLIAREACFTLRQMRVRGNDMKNLGLAGREIGTALEELLEAVADGRIPNETKPLMRQARKIAKRLLEERQAARREEAGAAARREHPDTEREQA